MLELQANFLLTREHHSIRIEMKNLLKFLAFEASCLLYIASIIWNGNMSKNGNDGRKKLLEPLRG